MRAHGVLHSWMWVSTGRRGARADPRRSGGWRWRPTALNAPIACKPAHRDPVFPRL